MLVDDVYKIESLDSPIIVFRRAIFPRVIILGSLSLLSASMVAWKWADPTWGGYVKFFAFFLAFCLFGLAWAIFRDKRMSLEKDGAVIVLTGKHWWGHRNKEYPSTGVLQVKRASPSDGSLARNKVLEVRLEAGLRFFLGFSSFGSFDEKKLTELGNSIEKKTQERLKMQS